MLRLFSSQSLLKESTPKYSAASSSVLPTEYGLYALLLGSSFALIFLSSCQVLPAPKTAFALSASGLPVLPLRAAQITPFSASWLYPMALLSVRGTPLAAPSSILASVLYLDQSILLMI